MEQVGYDTYCKLLDEVVKEQKGEKTEKEVVDIQIDLDVSSYISDDYISNNVEKIEIYQNIALCKNETDIENVIDEIIDRFGIMPKEVENLIEVARIKNLCKEANVVKISNKMDSLIFIFDPDKFKFEIVDMLIKMYKNKIKFSPAASPYITFKIANNKDKEILKHSKEFLEALIKN